MTRSSFGVAMIAAALLAACGEDAAAPIGAGGVCQTSNDCGVGACIGGVCNVAACERDDHCVTGERCQFGADGLGSCAPLCIEAETKPCDLGCGAGAQVCSRGVWGGCDAPAPEDEVCNGVDDDCDGAIDEDVPNCGDGGEAGEGEGGQGGEVAGEGEAGEGDGEGEGEGEAGEGEGEAGEGEGEGGEGEGEVECEPTNGGVEACDDVDNDCDDEVDEGFPEAEICGNDVDDDCNGEVDDTCACDGHGDCEDDEFCHNLQCGDALPAVINLTLVSGIVEDRDGIGAGDSDCYAILTVNDDERNRSNEIESNQPVWNHTWPLEPLRANDTLEVCVFDADFDFDDELGCIAFTAGDIVDAVRREGGRFTRPGAGDIDITSLTFDAARVVD